MNVSNENPQSQPDKGKKKMSTKKKVLIGSGITVAVLIFLGILSYILVIFVGGPYMRDAVLGKMAERHLLDKATYELELLRIKDGTLELHTIPADESEGFPLLKGYVFQPSTAWNNRWVIYFHGSHDKANEQIWGPATKYNEQGYIVVAFYFRGYGRSDGIPYSESDFQKDAGRMWTYAKKKLGIQPKYTILHGYSVGASIASSLFEKYHHEVKGLFLDRPMVSVKDAFVANGGGSFAGAVAAHVLGPFSVLDNLGALDSLKQALIYLITGVEDRLGPSGEELRKSLLNAGLKVGGKALNIPHVDAEINGMAEVFKLEDATRRKLLPRVDEK